MLRLLNIDFINSYIKKENIFTLKDALAPRPKADYIVNGLIPCPSLSILFGAPGTLKSFFLADLAICVAAGNPWLEPLTGQQGKSFETNKAGVYLLDYDNGMQRTHERIAALARAHQAPQGIPFYYSSMPPPPLDRSF
jgi:hypothetical protein